MRERGDTLKSEEVGEGSVDDEVMERNPRFGGTWGSGQLQTLGKGVWLGPVPTGLLGCFGGWEASWQVHKPAWDSVCEPKVQPPAQLLASPVWQPAY